MPLFKHCHLALAAPALLLGTGLRADSPLPGVYPLYGPSSPTPEKSQALQQFIARARAQAPHGPGDIIPPCIIAYGYTNQGVTDRHGYLIVGQPLSVPRWTTEVAAPEPPQRR